MLVKGATGLRGAHLMYWSHSSFPCTQPDHLLLKNVADQTVSLKDHYHSLERQLDPPSQTAMLIFMAFRLFGVPFTNISWMKIFDLDFMIGNICILAEFPLHIVMFGLNISFEYNREYIQYK